MSVEMNTVPQTEIPNAQEPSLHAQPRAIRKRPVVPFPPRGCNFLSEALLEGSSSRHPSQTTKLLFLHRPAQSRAACLSPAAALFHRYPGPEAIHANFSRSAATASRSATCCEKQVGAPANASLGGKLMAPTAVPSKIFILKEEPLPPEIGIGITGGVPGGVPGGQLGGVIGGVISDVSRTNLPIPVAAAAQPKAPIRVGGRVRPPRVLSKPSLVYPPLAKQTRVEGIVSIDAVIDTEGNVVEMSVVSGHPLLISAALDAVKKWKYEPTYLNDQAIAVQLIVTVTFQLDR